jgi:hypothetical protein
MSALCCEGVDVKAFMNKASKILNCTSTRTDLTFSTFRYFVIAKWGIKVAEEIVCPICDSAEFKSNRYICCGCGNGDRTRTLYYMYLPLVAATKGRSALAFTTENWLKSNWFTKCERSIFNGSNHLDIQNIERHSGSYSWVTCNHVLEHIENDDMAIKELYRILSDDGVLQITVPMPSRSYTTVDWGFPDPKIYGHWRGYGADFINNLKQILPSAKVLTVITEDKMTPFKDIAYLIAKSEETRKEVANLLFKAGFIVVPG